MTTLSHQPLIELDEQYNYSRFRADKYNFADAAGPEVGDIAPDFEATTFDGKTVKLSDYRGKTVVLETGSTSCPQYAARIEAMNKFDQLYGDVEFLLLYVREAHPGSQLAAHRSMDDKREKACTLQPQYNERRTILLDNLNGDAHRAYGSLPNMVYIIDPDGKILLKGEWNHPAAVGEALEQLEQRGDIDDFKITFRPVTPYWLIRVMRHSGIDAIFDFVLGLPRLIYGHIQAAKRIHGTEQKSG